MNSQWLLARPWKQGRVLAAGYGPAIPRKLWLGWGLASFPSVILSHVASVLLLRFMVDSLAIAAATAGMIFAAAKLWDAAMDPLAGLMSDRLAAPWGSRVPCVLVGGLLAALLLVGIFSVPKLAPHLTQLYLFAGMLLFATSYSIFKVSYLALATELTDDYHGRTQLMSSRVIFASLGALVGLGFSPMLLSTWGNDRDAYAKVAIILALVCGLVVLASCWSIRNAPAPGNGPAATMPRLSQILMALRDRPFISLAAVKFTYFFTLALTIAALGFFTKHVLGLSDFWLGTLLALHSIGSLASQPLWTSVSRQHGKRKAFMIASALCALGWMSWYAAAPGEPALALCLRALLIGFGTGGTFLLSQAMLPDTVEYEARRMGCSSSGGLTGIMLTIEQVSWGLGMMFLGAVMGLAGYIESNDVDIAQPDTALLAIRVCVSLVPALMQGLAILAASRYELSEDSLRRSACMSSSAEPRQ